LLIAIIGPSWSARDQTTFFSKKGGNALNVWVVNPDDSQPQQITNQVGESRQPWWSPDGDALAISCDRGTGKFEIWLSHPDGSTLNRLRATEIARSPFGALTRDEKSDCRAGRDGWP
jgi:Tol biopolymer transport system component